MDQNDFAYLMKRGREEEARKLVEEENRSSYAMSFPSFVEDMLKKYGKSRKNVAERTGLSQDYLYKVLRGAKKTSERDYILAICIGIGMNTGETDHALTLNGMAGLDNPDKRNYIIRNGILDHRDILAIDEMLEKVGLNPIRVSPDMKKSTIQISKEAFSAEPEGAASGKAAGERKKSARMPENLDLTSTKYAELSFDYAEEDEDEEPLFTEVERDVEAEHTGGLGPFDYNYWAIITVRSRDGRLFYVEGCYGNEYTKFLVLDEENYRLSQKVMRETDDNLRKFYEDNPELKEDPYQLYGNRQLDTEYSLITEPLGEVKVIEEFSSLCEASSSPFFSFYLDIEKATDDKCRETMAEISDARGKGIRDGRCIHHGEDITFAEVFNEQEPTKLEYFQVRLYGDGRKSFTVSHRSYYMQFYLQDLYPLYYGKPEKEEYYFETDDLNSLKGADKRYRYFFECLLDYIRRVYDTGGGSGTGNDSKDPEILTLKTELDDLARRACSDGQKGKPEDVRRILREAEDTIARLESMGEDMLEEHIINLFKLRSTAESDEEVVRYAKQMAELKDRLLERLKAGEEHDTVAGAMAQNLSLLAHGNLGNQPSPEEAKSYDEDAMAIIGYIGDRREGVMKTLYQTYVSYSFLIDGDEPERALEYLEKATELAIELEFDKDPGEINNVASMHYNRGWVLWHRLKNDEAMIYFGYALDTAERSLTISDDYGQALASLAHIGKGILDYYLETGKTAAAERLRKRLAKNGIAF